MNQWIETKYRMPEKNHFVLASSGKVIFIARWDGKEWRNDNGNISAVLVWQELPSPPNIKAVEYKKGLTGLHI